MIDDGERSIENAYIVACVRARNVDALYYALVRKRARCERGGFRVALRRLDSQWGAFMREIEVRGMTSSQAAPVLSEGGSGQSEETVEGDAATPPAVGEGWGKPKGDGS